MNHEEQDELWELLGKAPQRNASPFFANKVMHAIHRQPEKVTLFAWLRRWWFVPVTAGACGLVAAVSLMKDTFSAPSAPAHTVGSASSAKVDPLAEMVVGIITDTDEFEVSLSDLVATEDNSVWLAADPSSLF